MAARPRPGDPWKLAGALLLVTTALSPHACAATPPTPPTPTAAPAPPALAPAPEAAPTRTAAPPTATTGTAAPAPPTPAPRTSTAAPANPDLVKAQALFASRGEDAAKVEEAVALFEKAKAWTQAARACYQRLDLHEDLASDEDARVRWIDRGIEDACRALGAADVDAVLDALPSLRKEQAEPLYWLSLLYGSKIETAWKIRQAMMVSGFRRLFGRCVDLDERVFHGGPRRMRADFLCTAPGFMDGDFEKGVLEVDAAIALAPDYLEGYVLRARRVRVPNKDRAGFRADLERVRDAKEGVLPDVAPEQRVAKRVAKALLAQEAELFE